MEDCMPWLVTRKHVLRLQHLQLIASKCNNVLTRNNWVVCSRGLPSWGPRMVPGNPFPGGATKVHCWFKVNSVSMEVPSAGFAWDMHRAMKLFCNLLSQGLSIADLWVYVEQQLLSVGWIWLLTESTEQIIPPFSFGWDRQVLFIW